MKEIPDNAKLVFDGLFVRVYQWPQEMFDGSIETFERTIWRGAVSIIATNDKKQILFNEELQSGWTKKYTSLPCGYLDSFDEDPLSAAKRELLEETGLESDDWEHWYTWENLGTMIVPFYYYIARNCKVVSEVNHDNGEQITSEWISLEELFEEIEKDTFRLAEKSQLLKMKYDEAHREEFRKLIFGK